MAENDGSEVARFAVHLRNLAQENRALKRENARLKERVAALESQVLGPPVSSAEMAHAGRTWNDVAVRVANSKPLALTPFIPTGLRDWIGGRSYPELFEEAFGTPEVTPVRIALAIASFERTVYSDRPSIRARRKSLYCLRPRRADRASLINQDAMSVMPELFSATISFTTSAFARSLKTPDAFRLPETLKI